MARDDEALLRLVNLGMMLDHPKGRSASEVRKALYPSLSDTAYHQAFERDKNRLREVGIVLRTENVGDTTITYIDSAATYQGTLSLEPGEAAAVAVAANSALGDPAIPATAALQLGMARLIEELSGDTAPLVASKVALESGADGQGESVDTLLSALRNGAPVSFHYINAKGGHSDRTLEPYGLHFLNGRWYVVGREQGREDVVTFAVINMSAIDVGTAGTVNLPDNFTIDDHILLPFHFPPRNATESVRREVSIEIPADRAASATSLTRGHGSLTDAGDGSLLWETFYMDADALCRFVIDAGYRFAPSATAEREHLATMLDRLEAAHG